MMNACERGAVGVAGARLLSLLSMLPTFSGDVFKVLAISSGAICGFSLFFLSTYADCSARSRFALVGDRIEALSTEELWRHAGTGNEREVSHVVTASRTDPAPFHAPSGRI